LQADIIPRVLPEEDTGPVVGGVPGRGGLASGVSGPGDPDANLEIARDVAKEARGVHPADLGAQEMRRAGDEDRGPICFAVPDDQAIAVRVDDIAPIRRPSAPLRRLDGADRLGFLRGLSRSPVLIRQRRAQGLAALLSTEGLIAALFPRLG